MNEKLLGKIEKFNNEKEETFLSPFACKSADGIRKFPEDKSIRPVFFRDIDKIIHSRAYTRYIDKTQVFSLFENDHITHRVLHVQLVAKIGRTIGRVLKLNEDLIEAIALGHDIGHTPYGHDGEGVLNRLCRKYDIGYFCHNAQSVKCITEIEANGKLNTSLQVLDGILCHNGELLEKEYAPIESKTLEEFEAEYHKCFTQEDFSKKLRPMTLEGCVVRITDIIAYIGRDIEDAVTIGLIDRKDLPDSVVKVLGDNNSKIVDTLVSDLLENSFEKSYLSLSNDVFKALSELKEFNSVNIYRNPCLKSEFQKTENMFELLFNKYLENFSDKKSPLQIHYVAEMSEEYLQKYSPERIVIDFISTMTDDFFNNQFKQLFMPKSYGYQILK